MLFFHFLPIKNWCWGVVLGLTRRVGKKIGNNINVSSLLYDTTEDKSGTKNNPHIYRIKLNYAINSNMPR